MSLAHSPSVADARKVLAERPLKISHGATAERVRDAIDETFTTEADFDADVATRAAMRIVWPLIEDQQAVIAKGHAALEAVSAEVRRLRDIIEARRDDDTWTVAVEIPLSLPQENRDSLWAAVVAAAQDWEHGLSGTVREGWDVGVAGYPTLHEREYWKRRSAAAEKRSGGAT